jgi:UDP-glucose-4-epimerase GalE
MPSILVTGGAGFVGSHVCEALHAAGFLPVVLDDLSSGFQDFVQWGPFVQGRIGDRDLVRQICETHRPVACLHFAGLIEVGRSVSHPDRFYDTNVVESIALIDTLRRCGVNSVVFSSTAAVYRAQMTPLVETAAFGPESPYGRTKWMIEQYLSDLGHSYGMRSIALRYFNAAGGHPTVDIGESHYPETHLIPALLDFAEGRRPSFTVFGTDYPTPDGTCIRDYVHVTDLAAAHVMAIRHLLGGGDSTVFNVGTGLGHSVKEVVEAAQFVVGKSLGVHYGDRRAGDAPMLVANCDAIRSEWGWRPRRSDLHTLIADAWRWRGRANPILDR